MSKHYVTIAYPPVMNNERFNANGMVPSATLMRNVAKRMNFVACKAKKQVFMKCQTLSAIDSGQPAEVVWPFAWRTGENSTGLRVVVGMAPTDFAASTAPDLGIVIGAINGATLTTKRFYYNDRAGATVTPDEIHWVTDTITGLSANSNYRAHCECSQGMRIIALSVVELAVAQADDSVTAVCNSGVFPAEGDIYDSHMADLVEANNELWRHNGSHLLTYTLPYSDLGTVRSTAAFAAPTTYTNILDATSTSVAATSPGFQLVTQYHNTTNRTTVPVAMAVKAERTLGAGSLRVRITDGTNTLEFLGITTSSDDWFITTGTIPAQAAGTKWDLQARVSAAGTEFDIHSVCVWEFET